MKKRIASLAMAFVMIFSMVSAALPAYATPTEGTYAELVANEYQVEPGGTVNFTVKLGPVTNLKSLKLKLDIPSCMTFVPGSAKPTDALTNDMHAIAGSGWGFAETNKNGDFIGTLTFACGGSGASYTSSHPTEMMTFQCTVDEDFTGTPSVGFVESSTEMNNLDGEAIPVTYKEASVIVTRPDGPVYPSSLEISTPPNKTRYTVGEDFEPYGMKITVHYNDGTSATYSGGYFYSGSDLTEDVESVAIHYSEHNVTLTANQRITVLPASEAYSLKSLEITTPPTKTKYVAGEDFDPTGMVVYANFTNDTRIDVTADVTYEQDKNLTANQQYVRVKFVENGDTRTVNQLITVNPSVTLSRIILDNKHLPRADYYVGEDFDTTGMTVTAEYSDGSTRDVTDSCTIVDGTNLQLGNQLVQIKYEENGTIKFYGYNVTVHEKIMTSIEITTPPNKTEYLAGEDFDPTGMVVVGHFSDGSSETIDTEKLKMVSASKLQPSQKSITIHYGWGQATDLSVEQPITVDAAVTLTGIRITTEPTRTYYHVTDLFDPAGMVVMADYSDGSTRDVTSEVEYSHGSMDRLYRDDKYITVSYTENGITKTAQQPITVGSDLSVIEITTEPSKKVYIQGEDFDPTGMVVTACYLDGYSQVVTNWTVINGKNLTVNQDPVLISYTENGITKTAQPDIFVKDKARTPKEIVLWKDTDKLKKDYIEGEDFDPYGIGATIYYTDGSATSWFDFDYPNGKNLKLGQESVTVSYTENGVTVTAEQPITVSARTLTGLTVTTKPTKTSYSAGEVFDPTGMVITAAFNNGKTEDVTAEVEFSTKPLTAADTYVTISYTENGVTKTIQQPITVAAIPQPVRSLTSIEITTEPTQTEYVEGEDFNAAGMVVTAHYSNDTSAVLTGGWTVTDGESLQVGKENVTISYTEGDVTRTVDQAITVTAAPEPVVLGTFAITTPPTKTVYVEGEDFDPTGMVVTGTYSDGSSKVIEDYRIGAGENLQVGQEYVIIICKKSDEISISTNLPITVNPAPAPAVLDSIVIVTEPTKTEYNEGENFNPAGMKVNACYSDDSVKDVTTEITYKTEPLTTEDTVITISYIEGDVTKTVDQAITVNHVHDFDDVWHNDETGHWHECACGEKSDVAEHTYGDWTVTVEPTETTTGTRVHKCTVCGYEESQIIPVLPAKVTLESIKITQMPARTAYEVGENFDATGMIVTAVYSDETTAVVTGWTVTNGQNLTADQTSVTISYTEDGVTKTTTLPITVTPVEPPVVEQYAIQAQFVKKGWFGSNKVTLLVEPDGSVKAPNANGFLQRGYNWISEDGSLFVESNSTVTYDQLLKVLGGTAEEGAFVRFQATHKKPAPQPEPEPQPDPQPETQTVILSFQENGVEIATAEMQLSKDYNFVTSAQVYEHLPEGYDFEEQHLDYAVINGVATIPVVAVSDPGPIEPVENPITVTFKLKGWGASLKGTYGRTKTVTLNPGQSVKAPFADGFLGSRKTVNWTSDLGYQVTSGGIIRYEVLAELMGEVPQGASVTFIGSASRW